MENKTIRHQRKKLEFKRQINAEWTKLTIVFEEVTT